MLRRSKWELTCCWLPFHIQVEVSLCRLSSGSFHLLPKFVPASLFNSPCFINHIGPQCNPKKRYALHIDPCNIDKIIDGDFSPPHVQDNAKGLLLASDVAARGLDIPQVDHVIHYQVPRTMEVGLLLYCENMYSSSLDSLHIVNRLGGCNEALSQRPRIFFAA